MKIIKDKVKQLISVVIAFVGKFEIGRYIYGQVINNEMSRTQKITHGNCDFTFSIPTSLNRSRIKTFSTKEPETLSWIDELPVESILWDIGANIGLYSCYAAKSRRCKFFSFEPSVFNLELLARNIVLNNLSDSVVIVPLPLTDMLTISKLNMTTTEWGGALSTFDKSYGQDGKLMNKVFEFSTVGITMVDAINCLGVDKPEYIKMDVDGIEHLILQGGLTLLDEVKGIIIEIDDEFDEQFQKSSEYLTNAGLTMVTKKHSQMVEDSSFRTAYNQIWSRNS